MLLFVIAIIIASLSYYLLKKRNQKKTIKFDYSFDIIEIKNARNLLINQQFDELNKLLIVLETEILSATLDDLGINVPTENFLAWKQSSTQSELPTLGLAIHYLHQAWIVRTHEFSNNINEKKADQFFELQNLSLEEFKKINENSKYNGEIKSRLIRLNMGLGNFEHLKDYFNSAVNSGNYTLWPYLHYCEAIEPKWGGELTEIQSFLKELNQNIPFKYCVELKLILDSYKVNENYFEGSIEDLKIIAIEKIKEVDNYLMNSPSKSLSRYVYYGYIYLIAEFTNQKSLSKKYHQLIGNKLALYPFGIQV